jgi:hypothetical protein
MKTYTVKYRKLGCIFSRKLRKVKGDLMLRDEAPSEHGMQCLATFPVRVFILEDETRVEIPMLGHVFTYCKERHYSILNRMKKEAGQDINVEKE